MHKKLLAVLLGLSAGAQAMEVGPLRMTDEAGDWGFGGRYYMDQSQWNTGSSLGDDLVGDLMHQGPFGVMGLALHDRWEAVARVGFSEYETNPEGGGNELSSSADTFASLSLRGEFLRRGDTLFGPFVQYTRYSNYEISGGPTTGGLNAPLAAEVSGWQELSGGVAAQHRIDDLSLYYGIYHTDQKATVEGNYGSQPLDLEVKEEDHQGLFVGAMKPLTENLSLTAEYDHVSDWGISIGLNYKVTPPKPVVITRTEVRTEYVERPAPTGPAEINREVRFKSGSTAVDQEHWDEIREFAEFLNTYEGSEGFVIGHCDCLGDDDYNQKLSEERAESVKVLLVELFGIDESRLKVVGMGESQPKYEPRPGVGRPENRRVELKGRAYGEDKEDDQK